MPLSLLSPSDPPRVGDYAIARRIGSGGQGTVYEAYDPDGRRVAVKVLRPNGLRRPPAKEVTASRKVASFSTARVLDVDLDGDPPYLVSEFVDGPSLRTVVEEAGPYTGDALHRLAVGIATAVAAIHEAGVVHRDLKPDNVLLGPDGPRVIDFGIARVLEASSTVDGGLIGTPAYMAPELFSGDLKARPAADVYAWGAVVLFAATGQVPFLRDNVAATVHQVLNASVDFDPLPASLRPLVARAMSRDPAERPDARELLLALVGSGSGDDAAVLHPPKRLARPRPELGQVAEAAYDGLGPRERMVVPRVLLRLVDPDAEPQTVGEAELHDDGDEAAVETVLTTLAGHGLIVREGGVVRLAGPALVRAWPRLREWIEADRPGLAVHHRIRAAARDWEAGGGNDGDLLTGSALEAALGWAATARTHLVLNPLERRFLTASSALAGRRRRVRRAGIAALVVLLVASVGLGGLAETLRRSAAAEQEVAREQRRIAEEQRAEADARRDAAVARNAANSAEKLRQADPVTAMRLSVAAWEVDPGEEPRSALIASTTQPELAVFSPPTVDASAYSADGRTQAVASGSDVEIWDIASGTRRAVLTGAAGDGVDDKALELSRDGRFLLVTPYRGEQALWDVTARERMSVPGTLGGFTGGGRYLVDEKGKVLRLPDPVPATTPADALTAEVKEGYVEVRRVGADGEPIARLGLGKGGKPRGSLNSGTPVISDDGAWVAVPTGHEGLVLRSLNGEGRHRNAGLPEWAGESREGVGVAVFSPDGRTLASATEWAVQLWDTATLTMFHQFSYPGFLPVALAFRERGDTLVVGGFDGTVRTLDVRAFTAPRLLRTASGEENGTAPGALFSPDGKTLVTMTDDAIRFWDRRTLRQIGRDVKGAWNTRRTSLEATRVVVPPLAFSPDGKTLAAARSSAVISLIDVATTRERDTITAPSGTSSLPNEVLALAFSPDGRTLAVSEAFRTTRLLDTRTLRPVATVRDLLVTTLVWSPDGRTLALGGVDQTRLWRVGTDARPGDPLAREHSSEALLFSEDGGRLVVRGENECACASQIGPEVDARVWVWDTKQGRPIDPPLAGHTEPASAAAFSPDGRVLATVSADGTLRLWDATRHDPIGLPVERHRHEVVALAFDADGTTLTTVGADGSVHVLDLDPAAMSRAVCARAGGGLSPEEWRRHIPDVPFRVTCRPSA